MAVQRPRGSNLRYRIGPKRFGDDQSARGLVIQRSGGSNLRYRIGPKRSGDDQSARGLVIQRSRGSNLRYRIGPKTSGDDQSARGLVIRRSHGSNLRYRIGLPTHQKACQGSETRFCHNDLTLLRSSALNPMTRMTPLRTKLLTSTSKRSPQRFSGKNLEIR